MATIKEIASLAGVSRGTVDRVLNGRGAVSKETEEKIKRIAAELHYSPNRAGLSLATRKKNYRIGFILFGNDPDNPFFQDVLTGIASKKAELDSLGIAVEVHHTAFGSWQSQLEKLEELEASGIHGIAITPVNHMRIAEAIRRLMERKIPVVTVNTDIRQSGRLAYVGSNFRQSGRTAGNLMSLLTGGCASIGIVTGSEQVLCHTERVDGFREYLDAHTPDMRVVDIAENEDDDARSYTVTRDMLVRHPELDALYLAAAGVHGAGEAIRSLEPQRKLTVISFDCVPTTRQLILDGIIAATIGQQPHKQGSLPLDLLADYLAMGQQPRQDCFYTDIDIRVRENL